MMIDHKNILSRSAGHLTWATDLDIATAWATSNDGLRSLQQLDSPIRVRAVVGLWGNLTDPMTLRTLAEIGELRLVDATRRFHPKVFLFREPGRLVAWIGSANFTSGGFGMNEEAMFETTNAQPLASWFDQLWNRCGPIGDHDINEYAAHPDVEPHLCNPRHRRCWRQPSPRCRTLPESCKRSADWRDYVDALQQCDRWWSTRSGRWSVLGELYSWSQTIQELHDVVVRRDWRSLDDHDRQRMLGLTPGEVWWSLLGRMRPPAMQTVFGGHLASIQEIVQRVAAEPESAFPDVAVRAYAQLTSLDGIGSGIATRLLTLARPDRFVSLNGASKAGLAASFAVAPSTLSQPRNYGRLLEQVYGKALVQRRPSSRCPRGDYPVDARGAARLLRVRAVNPVPPRPH